MHLILTYTTINRINTARYCYMVRTGSDDVMVMDCRSMHLCHGAKCLVRNKPHEPNSLHESI